MTGPAKHYFGTSVLWGSKVSNNMPKVAKSLVG